MAILSFLIVEVFIIVFSYFRWLRDHSELPAARQQYEDSLKAHMNGDRLDQHVGELIARREAFYKKRKQLPILLKTGVAILLGLGLSMALFRLLSPPLLLKAIIAVILITPSMFLIAIAIAEEKDANNISNYEAFMKERLDQWAKEGTLQTNVAGMFPQEVAP